MRGVRGRDRQMQCRAPAVLKRLVNRRSGHLSVLLTTSEEDTMGRCKMCEDGTIRCATLEDPCQGVQGSFARATEIPRPGTRTKGTAWRFQVMVDGTGAVHVKPRRMNAEDWVEGMEQCVDVRCLGWVGIQFDWDDESTDRVKVELFTG